MSAITSKGEVDPVTPDDLAELAAVTTGPVVSVYLPTHRSGPETLQVPKRLRALLDRAAELGAGTELLDPMHQLLDDVDYWQHQSHGLALHSGPGVFQRHRLPVDVDEEVHVSETFRVRPLLSLLSDHDDFRILALSQNQVRLFDASRYHVEELVLDGVPTSLAEALEYEESTPRTHRIGGPAGQFHGHGSAEEQTKAEVERYFRVVDHALHERLGVSDKPLVLASVGYYLPIWAATTTSHTHVLNEVVEGNPEHRSPAELHEDAWELVSKQRSDGDAAWKRFQDASGTGLTATDLSTVVLAAVQGRVERAFVVPGPPVLGSVDPDTATVRVAGAVDDASGQFREDLVDRAVLEAVRHGGIVQAVAEGDLPDGCHVAALLRY